MMEKHERDCRRERVFERKILEQFDDYGWSWKSVDKWEIEENLNRLSLFD